MGGTSDATSTGMYINARNLRQITAATGSLMRFEIYVQLGTDMATYYWTQDVQATVRDQADFIEMTASERGHPSTAGQARRNIAQIGTAEAGRPYTGWHDVTEFTGSRSLVPAALTFLKSAKGMFVLNLNIKRGKGDILGISFRFKGEPDPNLFDIAIAGHLGRSVGRWAHLIDI